MIAAPLVFFLLTAPVAGPEADATSLVSRLGADRYSERERAAAALQTLGPGALSALRDALSAADAEIRSRAEVLLERIETEMLTRPTPVRLDYRDRPLEEVVQDLGEELGFDAELAEGAAERRPGGARVTARERGPLPFWEALRRLGLVGDWRPAPPAPFGEPRVPMLLLSAPSQRAALPTCDDGPFRVELRGPEQAGAGGLAISLEVQAEPGRLLRASGPLRLTEAVTDRGRSLLRNDAEPDPVPRPMRPAPADPSDNRPSPRLIRLARLQAPDPASLRLKRLKGFLPVTVMARRTVPTVIPLAPAERASGRSFANDDYLFIILSVREDAPKRSATIDFSIIPRGGTLDPFPMMRPRGRFRGDPTARFGLDQFGDQIEILDARGRPLPNPTHRAFYDLNGARLTLTFRTSEEAGPPAEIRFHDLVRATTDVQFEFRDLPLP